MLVCTLPRRRDNATTVTAQHFRQPGTTSNHRGLEDRLGTLLYSYIYSVRSVRILERHAQLRPVGFYLTILDYEVLVQNFCHAQIAQRLARALDRDLGRIFPGNFAGADDFNDLVDALRHGKLLVFLT